MHIRRRKGWEIPESQATPERVALTRRRLLTVATAAAAPALAGFMHNRGGVPATLPDFVGDDPSRGLYPAPRSMRYRLDREITREALAVTYNNFFEFGSSKNIWQAAQRLATRPWEIRIDGMVAKPRTIAIDDLLRAMTLEERLYRHRCVETWAMAVPWTGFALKDLVALCEPLAGARYVRFETFLLPEIAPGQRASWYPWPYVEGLAIDEAVNELAFAVTGIYGKPLPRQMGAPLRLALPWKYGFKSVKSIARISFVAERPRTFWEEVQGEDYGFWANVNPKVPNRRWSQETEELLGTSGQRVRTQLFNGYAEFVAHLYSERQSEGLWR